MLEFRQSINNILLFPAWVCNYLPNRAKDNNQNINFTWCKNLDRRMTYICDRDINFTYQAEVESSQCSWHENSDRSDVCVCVCVCVWESHSVVSDSVICQAQLSMEFSRQEYWSGLPFPSPGDLPDPGIEPGSLVSSAVASRFFTSYATREAKSGMCPCNFYSNKKHR